MTRDEHADALKKRGFRTFPIRENEKTPQFEGWQQKAGSYSTWWAQHPESNIGVATGHGLLVLDFDVKKGGLESLALLDEVMGLPRSYRVSTASGGVHVYLSCPLDCGVTVSVDSMPDFPGVDVRCDGGLVVAAGSVVDGSPYFTDERDVAAAPEWVLERCRAAQGPKRVAAQNKAPLVELDSAPAIWRAIDWLGQDAPRAVAGEGGNIATYKVAAWLRDMGISQAMAADMMFEHWNETKAEPPWGAEELLQIIDNAYRYATGAAGSASAMADFEPVEILEPVKKERKALFWLGYKEAAANALTQTAVPLIKGLLDQEAFSTVYGDSNTGKTFLMLDIAYHIAAGLPWQGRPVARGLVVYVAAEGGRGILKRIAALKKRYGGEDIPLAIVPCPINLKDGKADIANLLELIKEAEAHFGLRCVMVVVDTLSRALAGGDENASTDMGGFVRNIDKIRTTVKAHVSVVHHTGKDAAKGARGWSGLRAALDTEIEVANGVVTVSKQRDLEPIKPLKFTLDSLAIGKDEDGQIVTSCVVRVLTGSEFITIPMSGAEAALYEVLVDIAKDKNPENWREQRVSTDEWDFGYREVVGEGVEYNRGQLSWPQKEEEGSEMAENLRNRVGQGRQKRGASARTIRRLRTSLANCGHVKKLEQDQWVVC